jgi:hypothetical protein
MRRPTDGLSSSSTYFFGAGADFCDLDDEDREVDCRGALLEEPADARSDFVVLLAMVLRYSRPPTKPRNDAGGPGIDA